MIVAANRVSQNPPPAHDWEKGAKKDMKYPKQKNPKKKKLQQYILEIPRAQPHPDPLFFQIRNQLIQPRLSLLLHHGRPFDGADGRLGFVLRGLGQRVQVVEDIGGFGDAERLAHLGEHVGLRFAVLWGGLGLVSFLGGEGEREGERERDIW